MFWKQKLQTSRYSNTRFIIGGSSEEPALYLSHRYQVLNLGEQQNGPAGIPISLGIATRRVITFPSTVVLITSILFIIPFNDVVVYLISLNSAFLPTTFPLQFPFKIFQGILRICW